MLGHQQGNQSKYIKTVMSIAPTPEIINHCIFLLYNIYTIFQTFSRADKNLSAASITHKEIGTGLPKK